MARIFVLVVLWCANAAWANEAQIRKALEPKLGGAKIEGVQAGRMRQQGRLWLLWPIGEPLASGPASP